MCRELTFTISLVPRSVQFGNRAGISVKTGRPFVYSDGKKKAYQQIVRTLSRPFIPAEIFRGALVVDYVFIMPRPKTMMGKKHAQGLVPHLSRPDRDNLQKGTQDALAAFWEDDARIYDGRTSKYYAEKDGDPRIIVTIREVA